MSFVTISYCLDTDSGAIASTEPSVSLLYIWVAKMGGVGEKEGAVSCGEDSGVKHDLLKCFKGRCKQYAFLFFLHASLLECQTFSGSQFPVTELLLFIHGLCLSSVKELLQTSAFTVVGYWATLHFGLLKTICVSSGNLGDKSCKCGTKDLMECNMTYFS